MTARSETPAQIRARVSLASKVRWSRDRAGVPELVDWVIRRAVAMSPAERALVRAALAAADHPAA